MDNDIPVQDIQYKTRMYDFKKFFVFTVVLTIFFAIFGLFIKKLPLGSMAVSFILFILVSFTLFGWAITSWNTPTLVFTNQYFARQEGKKLQPVIITFTKETYKIPLSNLKNVSCTGSTVTLSFLDEDNKEQRITFYPPNTRDVADNINKFIKRP